MSIQGFNEFREKNQAAIQEAHLEYREIDALTLYRMYISWLIRTQNQKQVSATELLVQLHFINNFILNSTSQLQRYAEWNVKRNIIHRNHRNDTARNQLNAQVSSKAQPSEGSLTILSILSFIGSGLVATYLVHTSIAMTLGIMALSALVLPPILSFGFHLLTVVIPQARIHFTDPLRAELESDNEKTFNSNLKTNILGVDPYGENSVYDTLIQQTTLTLFETRYPKGIWSESINPESDVLDLVILDEKLTGISNSL